jgi:hypothetical protein
MWKKARNVRITYTPLPASNSSTSSGGGSATTEVVKVDDVVSYQSLHGGTKVKTVHGIDTGVDVEVAGQEEGKTKVEKGWAWSWRGKGLLMIASSRWEVLGYGYEGEGDDGEGENMGDVQGGAEKGNAWVVTYFAKTLFTPAGIDFYSRSDKGLKAETIAGIKEALSASRDEGVRKLADTLFDINMDGGQTGDVK